jgi:hypothetical protein
MKHNITALSIAGILSIVIAFPVSAQITATGTADVEVRNEVKASVSASSTATKAQVSKSTSATAPGTENRSPVATFVQELLKVADREKGIGAQVRLIAQQQQESNEKTADATTKIEKRSKLKTFFLGSDYKNLGILRSEIVKTEAEIAQLQVLIAKATTTTAKATLTAQLSVLQAQQVKVQSFINAHADTFSLFGWMLKKD